MELIIENIRSFAGKHTIPIKPLTLLTGENSSGKSTLLASLALVCDSSSFPLRPRFNEPPYSLNNYDSIATFQGGGSTQAESFSIGYKQTGNRNVEQIANYINSGRMIELSSTLIREGNNEIKLTFVPHKANPNVEVRSTYAGQPSESATVSYDPDNLSKGLPTFIFLSLLSQLQAENESSIISTSLKILTSALVRWNTKALSIAPMRTRPRRTYDDLIEEFSPEGEHIPLKLSSLLEDETARTALEHFGIEAGLYTRLNIKRLGNQLSDPMQIMVTNGGPSVNLMDVGYGVNQILPVVVQSILASPQTLLLIQQPEVHLHPRAQAALGSLFTDIVAKSDKQFVIETHSDYIIDRVRMDVARGAIPAKDVSILYLEKCDFQTRVHSLELSETGDILNAPPSYRAFFLEEEMNLFNRAGR